MSLRRNSWLIRYKGSPLTYLAFRMLAAREGVRMLFRSSSFGRSAFTIVRLYTDPFIDFIWKLLPASYAEDLLQLFFRKSMGNDFHGKILKIFLAFSFFLPARDLDHIFFCKLDNIKYSEKPKKLIVFSAFQSTYPHSSLLLVSTP